MIKKLTQLTATQESLLPAIRDEWLSAGLSTQPADRRKAVAAARVAYAKANVKEPQVIVWLDSPLAGAIGAHLLASVKNTQVRDQVWAQVRDQVGAQVGAQVYRCGYGLHDASWIGSYQAFGKFGIDVSRLQGLTELTQSCGWYWPFAGAIILTERPVALHRNARQQLHNASGMAIEYPDGWGLYCLNGVRVPSQIVTTPAEQLDSRFITTERNAEIRREFVRKAGIEKVCRDLGARPVDQQDSYELLLLNLGDGRERPYLKMKNPSIGVYHIEGVAPQCRTVRQALNWRNSLTDAEIDEINGADWYQQGDVVIRPSGVKTFKSQPIVLT